MFDLKSQLQDYVEANIERVDIDDLAGAVLDQNEARPQSPGVRRVWLTPPRRPVVAAGAAAMLIVLLIGGAWLLTSSGEESPVITQSPTPSSTVPLGGSTVPLGAPDSQWSSAVLDSAGLTGVSPRVLADGDGGLVIAYQREVEPSMDEPLYETLVVSCVNAECADPVIVQVAPPERSRLVEAALGRDGSPIVLLRRSAEIDGELSSSQSAVLFVCSDPTCASVEETVVAEATPMGLAVAPNGASVVAYGSWDGTGSYDIYLGLCEDAACRGHEPVLVGQESGFNLTSGALQLLPDGSPVLYYEDGPPSALSKQIVAACSDPGCSSVAVTEVMPGMGTDQGALMPDLPYWPYVSQFESVGLIGCGDESCTSISHRELYRPFDGTMSYAAHVTPGDDGMPALAVETISQDEWSGGSGDGYATHEVLWVLCGDPACETVSVRELGEGATISMALLSDDHVVVAAQTGLPFLCLVEGCADPAAEGLSTLTLYSCHGSDCLNPLNEDLVGALGDVAVLDGGVGSPMVFAAEGDLYVLEPGPGTARRLSEGADWEGGPVWSGEGARIAFHTDRDAAEAEPREDYNIYVMDADGTNLVQVTDDPAGEFFPDWSPDGTRLVFARQSEDSETRYLVIVDLATGEEQQLTDPTSDADLPAWSPDGTRIAFSSMTSGDCSWEGTDCNISIFTINTDGSGLTQLTDVPGIDAFPDWSPDGREIAFHTTRVDPTSGRWDIYVMSNEGSEVLPLTDDPGADQFPSWSPDGKLVLFQSDRSGTPHLYTMRGTDGSDITLIAPDTPNAAFPDWSPTTP